MIKVFQLDSYKIMPESPTFYGMNDKKLFDLDKHIDNYSIFIIMIMVIL